MSSLVPNNEISLQKKQQTQPPNLLAQSRQIERKTKALYNSKTKKNSRTVYLASLLQSIRSYYRECETEFRNNRKYTKTRVNSLKIIQHNLKKVLSYYQRNEKERLALSGIIKELRAAKKRLMEEIVKPKVANEQVRSILENLDNLSFLNYKFSININIFNIINLAVLIFKTKLKSLV